jgi:sterol desaturase/sphingolipid hydroxylase (fatty acid hydroxylase superfamily)
MSMHPIEHLIYFTCAILPLLSAVFPSIPPVHALHHIFAIYHACVAPIGGHDGYSLPGGGGDYHYLHHAALQCNFGVPLIDFDKLFGSWVELEWYDACGKNLRYAKSYGRALGKVDGNKQKALELVAKEYGTTVDSIKKGN